MTVAELIEKLKEMPQDLPVTIDDNEYGNELLDSVRLSETYYDNFTEIKEDNVMLQ